MANMNSSYARLNCIHDVEGASRSPVIFIHGFPDSPKLFADYHTDSERNQPWLKDRSIYTYSFPNRHDNPNFPPLSALMQGVMAKEFDQTMDDLIRNSPTGKLLFVAHDWGATHTWRWARSKPNTPIEAFIALSVGSSFRYDVFEHGLNAFTWLYGLWFGSGLYLPFVRGILGKTIVKFAGYRSDTAKDLWRDSYHYWDRPSLIVTLLFQTLFFLFYLPEYTNFSYPVLYMRTPLDRIASTAAFERTIQSRSDCRFVQFKDYNHWFPEQHSDAVLAEIRTFCLTLKEAETYI